MKIYTKTGDRGETGLFGGTRVPKSSLRVACYGDTDELNSTLGMAVTVAIGAAGPDDLIATKLRRMQAELFVLGAELASTPHKKVDVGIDLIAEAHVIQLESEIDAFDAALPKLLSFVLPGGTPLACWLHVARTVCRRAERNAVALDASETLRPEIIRYLNRLSDWLFTAARYANFRANVEDVPWQPRKT